MRGEAVCCLGNRLVSDSINLGGVPALLLDAKHARDSTRDARVWSFAVIGSPKHIATTSTLP